MEHTPLEKELRELEEHLDAACYDEGAEGVVLGALLADLISLAAKVGEIEVATEARHKERDQLCEEVKDLDWHRRPFEGRLSRIDTDRLFEIVYQLIGV